MKIIQKFILVCVLAGSINNPLQASGWNTSKWIFRARSSWHSMSNPKDLLCVVSLLIFAGITIWLDASKARQTTAPKDTKTLIEHAKEGTWDEIARRIPTATKNELIATDKETGNNLLHIAADQKNKVARVLLLKNTVGTTLNTKKNSENKIPFDIAIENGSMVDFIADMGLGCLFSRYPGPSH